MPPEITAAIGARYAALGSARSPAFDSVGAVAVRSSATAEDLPDASFAGQQDTYLNVVGRRPSSTPCAAAGLRCGPTGRSATGTPTASTTARVALAVVVQRMVDAAGGRGAVHRRPGDRAPAAHGDRRQPGSGRGGGLGRGQPGPVRGRLGHRRDRRARDSGDKRVAIRSRPGGGTERVRSTPARTSACLSDDQQVRDLVRLGGRVQAALRLAAGHRVGDRRRRPDSG